MLLEKKRISNLSLSLSYVLIAQSFIVTKLCMYVYLYNKLRIANQQSVKSKVITEKIGLERKEKNVIRLSGQASCFLVEMLGSISTQIIAFNVPFHASYLIPIIWIIASYRLISFTGFQITKESQNKGDIWWQPRLDDENTNNNDLSNSTLLE